MGSCIHHDKGVLLFPGHREPRRMQELLRKEEYIQILDENLKISVGKL